MDASIYNNSKETIEKFSKRFDESSNVDICWKWLGASRPDGYGSFWDGNKTVTAHRYAYFFHYGPIPSGMCVCHKCDNRICVNPMHLFLASNQGNTQDRHNKGRSAAGEKSGKNILTEEDVRFIRSSKETQLNLAKKFGVSRSTICLAKLGYNWKTV